MMNGQDTQSTFIANTENQSEIDQHLEKITLLQTMLDEEENKLMHCFSQQKQAVNN